MYPTSFPIPSQAKAEYRNEIFYPPYWYDFEHKPRITQAPSSIRYNEVGGDGQEGVGGGLLPLAQVFQELQSYQISSYLVKALIPLPPLS